MTMIFNHLPTLPHLLILIVNILILTLLCNIVTENSQSNPMISRQYDKQMQSCKHMNDNTRYIKKQLL